MGKAITEIDSYAGPMSGTTKLPVSDSDTLQAGTASQVLTYIVANLGNAATKNVGSAAGTVAAGDDARLSDERVPTAAGLAAKTTGSTSKTTPVDADEIPAADSAASFGLKKLTWGNIKATLKTYFDTLYQAVLVSGTNIKTINGSAVLGSGDLTVSALPGGSTTQIQYNNGGALGGASGITTTGTELAIASGTKTASAPPLTVSQTFNNSGVVFSGVTFDTTISAYAAGSKVFKVTYNGGASTYFSIDATGYINTPFEFQSGSNVKASGAVWAGTNVLVSGGLIYLDNSADPAIKRNAAGVVEINNGTAGTYRDLKLRNLIASGVITHASFTVATLPSASTSGAGAQAFVTDANATTPRSTVAGGGSNKVNVFSDGTNWLIAA